MNLFNKICRATAALVAAIVVASFATPMVAEVRLDVYKYTVNDPLRDAPPSVRLLQNGDKIRAQGGGAMNYLDRIASTLNGNRFSIERFDELWYWHSPREDTPEAVAALMQSITLSNKRVVVIDDDGAIFWLHSQQNVGRCIGADRLTVITGVDALTIESTTGCRVTVAVAQWKTVHNF